MNGEKSACSEEIAWFTVRFCEKNAQLAILAVTNHYKPTSEYRLQINK